MEETKLMIDEAYGNLDNAIRIINELNGDTTTRNRYFSLVVTHAQEAQNWLLRYSKEHLR